MIRKLAVCLLFALPLATTAGAAETPNIVVIFVDDMGYGDLGVYGHPTIRTPNLDRMASEGMRFTQFYAAAPLCTPSRAALLTGRLPIRNGMTSDVNGVLFPNSLHGLPPNEITIAEALKTNGYATAAIGKWHLGHRPEYLPLANGFDSYFGIPFSNDMNRIAGRAPRELFLDPRIEYWDVPLMRDGEIIEQPANQVTITRRYTEEAVQFIREHRDDSFFLYLAHSLPHVPLFRDTAFAGVSERGLYGDVVEELDWSAGEIMRVLREEDLAQNTLVFFTSDNGPWLSQLEQGGSAGLLRGGKGMTWEGGVREPAIAWWPGTIEPGVVETALASTLDLFPSILSLAEVEPPADRIIDGRNIVPLLTGEGDVPADDPFFYYRGTRLYAVRVGPWKAHFMTEWAYARNTDYTEHDPPLLFDLNTDPSEQFNVAAEHPEVIADLLAAVAAHRERLVAGPDQLAARGGP